jgi:hypothetical protein
MNGSTCMKRLQRGIAPWVLVVIVALVIAAVVATAVTTSSPTTPVAEGGQPPAGCIPAGTQCRVFIQNEVWCCGGRKEVGARTGACIGWWDALPCGSPPRP